MKVPDSAPRVWFLFRAGATRIAVKRFFGRYTHCKRVKRAAGALCLYHWWNEPSLIGKNFINKSRGTQISAARSRGNRTLCSAAGICGATVWNLLDVTLQAHRILRWLLYSWEICAIMSKKLFPNIFFFDVCLETFATSELPMCFLF
jgi:hypothetical protein